MKHPVYIYKDKRKNQTMSYRHWIFPVQSNIFCVCCEDNFLGTGRENHSFQTTNVFTNTFYNSLEIFRLFCQSIWPSVHDTFFIAFFSALVHLRKNWIAVYLLLPCSHATFSGKLPPLLIFYSLSCSVCDSPLNCCYFQCFHGLLLFQG